jgi:integrase
MFTGFDKPYWIDRGGMTNHGVCTCQEVWDDYCAFRQSMEFDPEVRDADRARRQHANKFDVTEDELKRHVRWLAGKARERATTAVYVKFWNTVVLKHCHWKGLNPWALDSGDVADLLAWHEMQGKAGEVERLYNAMRVVYASRDLTLASSPLAKEIVKGAARVHAEEKGDITREGFPMSAFRELCERPELYQRSRTGIRDRAVIGLGLRCMRRPSELSKLRRKHVCWTRPTTTTWVDPPGAHPWHAESEER